LKFFFKQTQKKRTPKKIHRNPLDLFLKNYFWEATALAFSTVKRLMSVSRAEVPEVEFPLLTIGDLAPHFRQ
jgi:hypothetical protein